MYSYELDTNVKEENTCRILFLNEYVASLTCLNITCKFIQTPIKLYDEINLRVYCLSVHIWFWCLILSVGRGRPQNTQVGQSAVSTTNSNLFRIQSTVRIQRLSFVSPSPQSTKSIKQQKSSPATSDVGGAECRCNQGRRSNLFCLQRTRPSTSEARKCVRHNDDRSNAIPAIALASRRSLDGSSRYLEGRATCL